MKNPRTGDDFTVNECVLMIAGLCDVIKRLELAIQNSGENRAYYVAGATEKRRDIERKILGEAKK